jgi:hypothetical protein
LRPGLGSRNGPSSFGAGLEPPACSLAWGRVGKGARAKSNAPTLISLPKGISLIIASHWPNDGGSNYPRGPLTVSARTLISNSSLVIKLIKTVFSSPVKCPFRVSKPPGREGVCPLPFKLSNNQSYLSWFHKLKFSQWSI